MTPIPARFALIAGAAAVVLALAGTAGAAGAGASPRPGPSAQDGAMALVAARDRSARADAAVDGLRRALTPGHLVDPLPEAGSSFTLDGLRADYSDMQRRAAGYRATLGDHHPTLATAALVLAELKQEITEETRRVLAAAERDAAQAHAAQNLVERAAAAGARPAEDATGSIAAAVPSPASAASSAARPAGPQTAVPPPDALARDAFARDAFAQDVPAQDTPAQDASAQDASASDASASDATAPEGSTTGSLAGRAAASAGVLLAVTAALWGAVSRTRRVPTSAAGRDLPRHRREPALVVPAGSAGLPVAPDPIVRPAVPEPKPVRATLPVPGRGAPRDVAAAMAQCPDGPLARDAASILATLASAHGDAGRMSVLVLRTEDVAADQGDGAALALAIAAAARGQRVALMEARPAGRLRHSTVPAGTGAMLIAAGGTARTAYRFAGGGAVVVVLPSDAGEAEAAASAARRDGTLRLDGLDVFDLVVIVGERAAALSRAADLVLVVAGPETAAETVAAAAKPCRAMGRVCRTLTLEPAPVASQHQAPQADPARDAPRGPALAARDEGAPPALRGTFGAESERLVA